jgi:hypothetical protein
VGDDDLRELQRAASDGGTAARLRLGRALERLGRRDEALVALQPAREDPEARLALARFPAWTHEDGSAGRTRAVDVAPIRREPSIRFAVAPRNGRPARALLAGPLGIVWVDREGTIIIDDETGATRWSCPEEAAAIAGDVILLIEGRRALVGRDIWTGERLHETPIDGFFSRRGLAGSVFVGVRTQEADVLVLDDPRRAPSRREPLAIPGGFMDFAEADVVLVSGLVLVGKSAEVLAIDLESGEVRYRLRGQLPHADEQGAVLSVGRRGGLAAHDHAGVPLFSTDEPLVPLALAPEFIVAARAKADPHVVVALDRRSGERLGPLVTLEAAEDVMAWASARDAVYVATERRLVAATARGLTLWTLGMGDVTPGAIDHLVPQSRRLLGTTMHGQLFCLEEPP